MTWIVMALAGGVGALVVGVIGFGILFAGQATGVFPPEYFTR